MRDDADGRDDADPRLMAAANARESRAPSLPTKAAAYIADRNVRFPARPALVRDVDVLVSPELGCAQVRGGPVPVLIRGDQVAESAEYLRQKLDGSCSVEALMKGRPIGISEGSLLEILMVLHMRGLVVDGSSLDAGASEVDYTLSRQLLFWGRKLGGTGYVSSPLEAQQRLSTFRVVLVAGGLFGRVSLDMFSRQGVSEIHVIAWDDPTLERESNVWPAPPTTCQSIPTNSTVDLSSAVRKFGDRADIIVSATRAGAVNMFRSLNQVAFELTRPLLLANDTGSEYDIGPFIEPFRSACYTCVELRRASVYDFMPAEHTYQEYLGEEPPVEGKSLQGESLAAATLAASILSLELARIATRIATPTLHDAVLSVAPLEGLYTPNRVMRVPRCPTCGGVSPPPEFSHVVP